MDNLFLAIFNDYTLRVVALGAGVLGISSGVLGVFSVLRKQSLLGDVISHATLPGVALAFLLTRSKDPLTLVVGAAITGWLATLWMNQITRRTRIKEDSALGMVLAVFFGLGLVLLTLTQRIPDASQAGLDRFLFGQAAALLERDVITMTVLGGLAVLVVLVFWKEFKLLSFDREYTASLGFPVQWLEGLLTTLLVIAIVIGLQAVGVVLMSALIIAPAAAARQWTDRLGWMVVLAAGFGAVSGVSGTVISSLSQGLSTGPVIVLVASAIVLISLLGAPNRGLAWNWIRQQRNRRSLHVEAVLADLYELAVQHGSLDHSHSIAVLRTMNTRQGGVQHSLEALAQRGWVRQVSDTDWVLTETGREAAKHLTSNGGQLGQVHRGEASQ
jgi:manganese/zinc/iron transport system permease protein